MLAGERKAQAVKVALQERRVALVLRTVLNVGDDVARDRPATCMMEGET